MEEEIIELTYRRPVRQDSSYKTYVLWNYHKDCPCSDCKKYREQEAWKKRLDDALEDETLINYLFPRK